LHSLSYAFHVDLTPEEVFPGDVFLLKINTDNNAAIALPDAEFAGKKIDFYQDSDDHVIALVPVDINTSPRKYDIKVRSGKDQKIIYVNVKPFKFPTIKMTLPKEKVTLNPKDLKRAEKEVDIMNKVLSQSTGRKWNGLFTTPTDTEVSEVFGVKRIMNKTHNSVHRGIDYRGKMGTPVRAVNSGTVVLRKDLFFGGNTLVIDHGMGLFSIYMHLSEFHVSMGETVSKGQVIGLVGMTGRATGPHLHFGFKLAGVSVNPEALFKLEL
jgi:murein DD-endopeptidase MepM/ murein hydrolase activator NlpD